jgi:hypothetical protein
LLNEQRCCQDRSLVGAETLTAIFTLAATANAPPGIMGGVYNLREIVFTVRTAHITPRLIRTFVAATGRGI